MIWHMFNKIYMVIYTGDLTMRALADRAAFRWVLQPQEQLKRTMRERSGGNEGR